MDNNRNLVWKGNVQLYKIMNLMCYYIVTQSQKDPVQNPQVSLSQMSFLFSSKLNHSICTMDLYISSSLKIFLLNSFPLSPTSFFLSPSTYLHVVISDIFKKTTQFLLAISLLLFSFTTKFSNLVHTVSITSFPILRQKLPMF